MEPTGLTIAAPLGICPACGRCLVIIDGSARLAAAGDTQNLSDLQKIAFRKLRPR